MAAGILDWSELVRHAERHGVLSFLHAPLSVLPTLPAGLRDYLRQRRELEQLWEARLGETLAEILAAFAAVPVHAVTLKGPVLGERLYGDASLRRSTDLDLLVAPADLEGALSILQGFDYQTEGAASIRYHRRFHHHWSLTHARRPPVELHFRVYTGYGVQIPAEPYLARARLYQTQHGARCYTLAPEDEFLYLALHAAGHNFARLSWLYDLKLYLRRYPALDWEVMQAQTSALGLRTAFAFAAVILRERLEVAVPALTTSPATRSRLRLARRWLQQLEALSPGSARAKWASLVLQTGLCDRTVTGVWLLGHHLQRVVRRRLHRRWPQLVPADWAG